MTTRKRNREVAAGLVRSGRGFVLIVHDGEELRMLGDVSRMKGEGEREVAMRLIWQETVKGFGAVMESIDKRDKEEVQGKKVLEFKERRSEELGKHVA